MSNSTKSKGPCGSNSGNTNISTSAISGITLDTKSPCIAYLVMQEQLREEAEARAAAQKARNNAARLEESIEQSPMQANVRNNSGSKNANTNASDSSSDSKQNTKKKPSIVDKMKNSVKRTKNAVVQKVAERKETKEAKKAEFTSLVATTYDFILEKFNVPYTSVCKPVNGGSLPSDKPLQGNDNASNGMSGKRQENATNAPNGKNSNDNSEKKASLQEQVEKNQANNSGSNNTRKQVQAQSDEISNAARNAFLYVLVNGEIPSTLVELVSKEEFTASERVQNIIQDKTLALMAASLLPKKGKQNADANEDVMDGGKAAGNVEEAFALCVKFFMKKVKDMSPSLACNVSLSNSTAGTVAAISYGTHYKS